MFGLEAAILAKVQMKMAAADAAFAKAIRDLFRHFLALLLPLIQEPPAHPVFFGAAQPVADGVEDIVPGEVPGNHNTQVVGNPLEAANRLPLQFRSCHRFVLSFGIRAGRSMRGTNRVACAPDQSHVLWALGAARPLM